MFSSRAALLSGVVAAGILGVTGAKKVNFDFSTGSIPSEITVSRSTVAGYLNGSGVYAMGAANTGRIDHTSAGAVRGLMVEPMTSNYCLQSRTLSSWTGSGCTIATGATSYDGTATAFKIAPTSSTGYHDIRLTGLNYLGKNVVLSAIVKADGYRYFDMGITNSVSTWGAEASVVFDSVNLTVTLKSNANYTLNSSGCIAVGNGFYLVWANINSAYTAFTAVWCAPTPNANGATGSYAGNTAYGAIVASFQIEPARSTTSVPSGHFTTTTAVLQRQPELVSFTIPAGVKSLLYTFDDGTTQQLYVTPGSYTIPTNLCNGRRIKSIVDVNIAYDVPNVFLETDMSTDIGDLFGLQMLIAEANAGKCRIIGVNANTYNAYSAPMIAAVLKHCGYSYVPVGAYQGSEGTSSASGGVYAQSIAARFGISSETRTNYPDATDILRQALAARADGSVTICSIGLFTNLKNLLQSAADGYSPLTGLQLVTAKVKKLVAMAGYAAGGTEWNFSQNASASNYFVANFPSAIPSYYQGYELGSGITFTFPVGDPLSNPFVYGAQIAGGTNERMWDIYPLMQASEGSFSADFIVSQANGSMTVNATTGANVWSSSPAGSVNYMGLAVSGATTTTQVNAVVYNVS